MSAIEWIMERYAVTCDEASGIVNNANDWAKEYGNPRYIFTERDYSECDDDGYC